MFARVDRSLLWRAAAVQTAAVAILSIALALALPHRFFTHWGWVSGPVAWIACAAVTARVLRLRPWPTLAGAALSGLPAIPAVLLGVHWLGAVIAIGLFALWCATGHSRGGSTPKGNRTPASSVKGSRADRYTMGAGDGPRV
jgi:hypothetical protein